MKKLLILCLLPLSACAQVFGPDPQEARVAEYCSHEAHPAACVQRLAYEADQYRNINPNISTNPNLWNVGRLP